MLLLNAMRRGRVLVKTVVEEGGGGVGGVGGRGAENAAPSSNAKAADERERKTDPIGPTV